MIKRSISETTLAIILSALVLLTLSCSDKGLNDNDERVRVGMILKISSPGLVDQISKFRVVVTADDIETPIDSPLIFTGRYFEGSVAVPPGSDRTFTVEAADEVGVVLYRGDTTLSISPGADVDLRIDLHPEVSLTRVSPHFVEVDSDSVFSVKVQVFNVPDLYGITFRLRWSGTAIYPDSAASLFPQEIDPIFVPRREPDLGYYAFGVSNSNQGEVIVDTEGHRDIVRVFFTARAPVGDTVAVDLQLDVTGLTDVLGEPIGDVRVYPCIVVVSSP